MLIQQKETMQAPPRSPLITLSPTSPSFGSYSSSGDNLADVAARVVHELSLENYEEQKQDEEEKHQEDEEEEEEGFEFTFVYGPETEHTSPVSADDIFHNGKIMPMHPLFDTTLLNNNQPKTATEKPETKTVRLPLRKLFYQEKFSSSSFSSSSSCSESDHQECSYEEEEGLDGLPPGTYCVWAPEKKEGEGKGNVHGRKMKSNSTGSTSKRWKLRDLLYKRSSSDGKETIVFLAPVGNGAHGGRGGGGKVKEVKGHGINGGPKLKPNGEKRVGPGTSDKTGMIQIRDRTGEFKRQTYLPYRKDLVGICHSSNGLSKNLHQF